MTKKFIAHQGNRFTIEWYFNSNGKSTALDSFKDLSLNQKKKLIHLFYLLGDVGKIFNKEKFRYEGDQIYAMKLALDRFLCFFFKGSKVVVTNVYKKKVAKMPQKEKLIALKAKDDYEKRCKKETYY